MATLVERLGVEPHREKVIADCVTLIDHQVKSRGGMSGIAVRASYATIKAIKRRFVPEVVDGLLDEWLGKLQPHYDRWSTGGGGGGFSEFLIARSDDVAEDLLAVTDARAETTSHTTAKKAYVKMRPSAKKNVIEAIPELAKLVEKHLAEVPSAPEA
ncbi:MAG: hypothetical protein H6709_16630 [Kofleriaceae bacterium]|nr:hypothetical protein [Kofleriaceae bacterium]MCB9573708.1 hypothetical protein [Kofleriaceae bacterium]